MQGFTILWYILYTQCYLHKGAVYLWLIQLSYVQVLFTITFKGYDTKAYVIKVLGTILVLNIFNYSSY